LKVNLKYQKIVIFLIIFLNIISRYNFKQILGNY